ncbi:MAG: RNA polymerase sigma factor [Marinifilaceae bacterium]
MVQGLDIKGINNQNMAAWELLYKQFYSALCVYAVRFIQDEDVVKDIVQDTLVRTWTLKKQFSDEASITWYFYRAVHNNCLYYLRNNKRIDYTVQINEFEDSLTEDEFTDMILDECCRQLLNVIDKLPKEQKHVMQLTLEGFSGAEIAEKLGISISTVKTHKYRSFKYIRRNVDSPLIYLLSIIQQQ